MTGEDLDFSTPTFITTLAATGLQHSAATLNALLEPFGLEAAYYFEYGTTTNYGSFTATNSLGAYPGWILQESLSLASVPWSNAPSGPTNPAAISVALPTKFYRLFKP